MNRRMDWLVAPLLILVMLYISINCDVIVEIEEGSLRGTTLRSIRRNKEFFAFLAIPFAEPPLGNLRFQAPKPFKPWKGIKNATEEGPACPQVRRDSIFGEEDCLHLHVFTPKIPSKNSFLRPVVVWFFPAAFIQNSNSRENAAPDHFIEENIVFVSPNYRLGPLGFLSLQTKDVPGNAGLKDQVLALKWVRRNIAKFGGDPHSVTIIGVSSGATSVFLHLLSPMSRGLFHRAIAESGTALRPWYYEYPSCNEHYLESLGLNATEPAVALQHLMELNPFELLKSVTDPVFDATARIPFCPTKDIKSPPGEVFLPDSPYNLLQQGRLHEVPLITGINNAEGMKYLTAIREIIDKGSAETYLEEALPPDLVAGRDDHDVENAVKKIKHFYFSEGSQKESLLLAYIKYITDLSFFIPMYCTLKIQSEHFRSSPQYAYEFTVDGSKHLFVESRTNLPGASHTDEMSYLYGHSQNFTDFKPGSIERLISRRIVKMWTNFVKFGNPTPVNDSLLKNIKWSEFNKYSFRYMDIGEDLALQNNMRGDSLTFWKKLYHEFKSDSVCWT